jgi:hypothetical protein
MSIDESHIEIAVRRGKAPRPASRLARVKNAHPLILLDLIEVLFD